MTGREMIIYILTNGLENEEVFKDGKLLGFLTVEEAAVKYNVGLSTIKVWVAERIIKGIVIGNQIYIPANEEYSRLMPLQNSTVDTLKRTDV